MTRDGRRRTPEELLREVQAEEEAATRGHLKIFLGYASGVGKTVRMLAEAVRRRERGQTAVSRGAVAHSATGVRLISAALCLELDCSTVFDGSAAAPCPRCGSVMSYPLAAWLDRGAHATARPR